ncbi:nuclear pore complex protein NUP98A [Drosophila erecta]|uniref:nuclear pore complex protein NUP98A n=1 Tax=Drosophila erecta TaxID=7220 RepID=UPI000732A131|nr:nuclear pore complex protein NUP98A [Drosophila erecta]EDV48719.2 uncharacterized protein Dere_GG22244 [Drosophila erecta]
MALRIIFVFIATILLAQGSNISPVEKETPVGVHPSGVVSSGAPVVGVTSGRPVASQAQRPASGYGSSSGPIGGSRRVGEVSAAKSRPHGGASRRSSSGSIVLAQGSNISPVEKQTPVGVHHSGVLSSGAPVVGVTSGRPVASQAQRPASGYGSSSGPVGGSRRVGEVSAAKSRPHGGVSRRSSSGSIVLAQGSNISPVEKQTPVGVHHSGVVSSGAPVVGVTSGRPVASQAQRPASGYGSSSGPIGGSRRVGEVSAAKSRPHGGAPRRSSSGTKGRPIGGGAAPGNVHSNHNQKPY